MGVGSIEFAPLMLINLAVVIVVHSGSGPARCGLRGRGPPLVVVRITSLGGCKNL